VAQTRIFASSDEISEAFVQLLGELTTNRLDNARPALVALSGGSTPKSAYEHLYQSDVDKSKIEAYMVDERYVPPSDDRSNEAMLRAAMPGEELNLLPMYTPGGAEVAASVYHRLLRKRVDAFDLVLLGMGDDGHTASIFPGMWPEFPEGAWCVASKAPVVCEDRITLTPRAICLAKHTIFMVTGESKADRIHEVLQGPKNWENLPAQYIGAHAINCEWWLDRAAASRL
jgi:6-phosphogluconolactonase